MDIINRIKSYYDDLTNTQKAIADYLITNPSKISYITLKHLSEEIGCSEATILNFCDKIGCLNFIALKKEFRSYNEKYTEELYKSTIQMSNLDFNPSESNHFLKDIIENEKDQIRIFYDQINFNQIESVCDKILEARYIYIVGHDMSKTIGSFLYTRLEVLNLSPVLVDLSDIQETEYILSHISADDLVFFISFPNYYYASEGVGKIISENTDKFILLTDSIESPVSPYTENILFCETSTKVFNNSWITPLACLNIITNRLAIKMNVI